MLRLDTGARTIKVRALVFDLDRTLTDRSLRVVPAAVRQLDRARNAGAKVVLATGRNRKELERRHALLRHFDTVIAESGGVAGPPGGLRVTLRANGFVPRMATWLDQKGIDHLDGDTTVSIRADDRPRLRAYPGLEDIAIHPNRDRVDLVPAGVDKGSAVRRILGRGRGVVAFADGANDRSLFEFVDHAVAVANAVPSLRRLADASTRFYGGFGVADYLKRSLREDGR